jgi:hypothetical protein
MKIFLFGGRPTAPFGACLYMAPACPFFRELEPGAPRGASAPLWALVSDWLA